MIAAVDFVNYSITGVSSQDADWPASSLKTYDSSTESWRTVGTGAATLTLDLGAQVAAPRVLLYRTNYAAVKFYGNNSDSWGSPAYVSGQFSILKDPDHRIYKRGVLLSGFNHRFLRIEVPSQGTVNGMNYFETGVLAVIAQAENFAVTGGGFGLPLDIRKSIAEMEIRYETNRSDRIPLSDVPTLTFNLSGNMKASPEIMERVQKIFGDPLKSVVFVDRAGENADNAEGEGTWKTYIVRRAAEMEISELTPKGAGARSYAVTLETIL